MVGFAVKVTVLPEQVGLEPVVIAIDADGVTVVFTVIVIPALVAVVGEAQVAFDVITTSMISPLISVVEE